MVVGAPELEEREVGGVIVGANSPRIVGRPQERGEGSIHTSECTLAGSVAASSALTPPE